MTSEETFLSSFQPAIEMLLEHVEARDNIRILTHSDADGIAAGGILSIMAKRLNVSFKTSCEKRLDEESVRAIASERQPLNIFSDVGSGYLDTIEEILAGSDVIIIDHHIPIEIEDMKVIHLNPIIHGLDGSRGVSGAGIAYLLSRNIDPRNIDLSPLGIVGALADQQDKGDKKSLIGINRLIEEDAIKAGLLQKKVDLILYGHETRPIAKALAFTTTPFLPGLSGMEDRCVAFLKNAGIELKKDGRWLALRDLSELEKQSLFSALSKHLIFEGCGTYAVYDLIGTIYTLTSEEPWTPMRDAREYASLLNACARVGRPSVGLAICLGDRDTAVKEAEVIQLEYRSKIAKYLNWVKEGGRIKEKENIYTLPAGVKIDERIIGVIASILLSMGILKKPKPLIAWAKSNKSLIKISARATEAMASDGLDLGTIMIEAVSGFEGRGGGHDIAAGAFISEDGIEDFLNVVDELVGKQKRN